MSGVLFSLWELDKSVNEKLKHEVFFPTYTKHRQRLIQLMLFTVLLEENMDRNPEFDYSHFELTDIDIKPWKQSKLH